MKTAVQALKENIKPYAPEFMIDLYRWLRKLLNISPYPDIDKDPAKELPILVYQMGKVGSRSIIESLRKVPSLDVFHVHRIGIDIHPNLYHRVIAGKERVKIISMVRDPITRNISSYFHLLDNHFKTRDAHTRYSMEEITRYFFEYIKTDVEDAIGWFDTEFKVVTGVDIYQYDFPRDRKWATIEADPFEVLILRVDLEDEKKAEIIADFLHIETLELARSNIGDSRSNGAEYKNFVNTIKLPDYYLDRNLDSSFTRHFYSAEEIQAMHERWKDN